MAVRTMKRWVDVDAVDRLDKYLRAIIGPGRYTCVISFISQSPHTHTNIQEEADRVYQRCGSNRSTAVTCVILYNFLKLRRVLGSALSQNTRFYTESCSSSWLYYILYAFWGSTKSNGVD